MEYELHFIAVLKMQHVEFFSALYSLKCMIKLFQIFFLKILSKKAQWWKTSFKKCFCKGKILKGLESLCMLTYPVVNTIAFSCKIMTRKIFSISQHFFFCKNRLLFSCLHRTCTSCIRNLAQEKKKGHLHCRSNSREYSSSLWLEMINIKKRQFQVM